MQPTIIPQQNPQASAHEQNIPAEERLRNGQYYTPANVCDFMLALSKPPVFSDNEPLRVLEPGCGPGSFLLRLADGLEGVEERHSTTPPAELFGIDLDASAAALAQSLLPRTGKNYNSTIQTLNFISPEADQLGLFDWIIGNPPYVRQEHLAQSQQMDKKAMLHYLVHKYEDYLRQYPAQKVLFAQTADLYLWFFLQATSLLKPGGRLTFITSNSWLNTAAGQYFQQFLTHHFKVLTLAESACERWFADAAINPLIVVLEKKALNDNQNRILSACKKNQNDKMGYKNPVNLIRLLKPLGEFLPDPQQVDYWTQLTKKIQQLQQTESMEGLQINRLRPEQLQTAPFQSNWALPLRASREITDLLNTPMLWQKLEELGQVRYPLKTGINAFFYLSKEKAAQWQIEPEFLFPVLRSSRQVKDYIIQAHTLQEFLFSCPYTTQELAEKGHTGALAYVEWGTTQSSPPRQKRAEAVRWPEVPSIQSNRPWHYTKPLVPAHLLCPRFIDQRFFFPLCQGQVMEDQTFYGFTAAQPEQYPPLLIAALLNSTLSYLLAEFSGRSNLGEGVLQFARCDMAAFSIINPDLFSQEEKETLIEAFQQLCSRPILPLEQELFSPERIAMDALILAPVLQTLNSAQPAMSVRERLALQLLGRVQERQNLANSLKPKSSVR